MTSSFRTGLPEAGNIRNPGIFMGYTYGCRPWRHDGRNTPPLELVTRPPTSFDNGRQMQQMLSHVSGEKKPV